MAQSFERWVYGGEVACCDLEQCNLFRVAPVQSVVETSLPFPRITPLTLRWEACMHE